LKMGVKEVLVRTRDLGWGSDAHIYDTEDALRRGLSRTLGRDRVRVVKQNRGNGSQGVWKVSAVGRSGPVSPDTGIEVVEARADVVERMTFQMFLERCEAYVTAPGLLIDQAFQPRVGEGLVRCYMSGAEVVG